MNSVRYLAILILLGLFLGFIFPHQGFAQVDQNLEPNTQENTSLNPTQNSDLANQIYMPIIEKKAPLVSVFGIELNSIGAGPAESISLAGAMTTRLNGLEWSEVEPVIGARNWDLGLEQELITASNQKLQVILIIRSTPTWAQLRPGYFCGPMKQEYFDEFAQFVREAVEKYSRPPYSVLYYEIWNEPDVDPKYVNQNSIFGCWGNEKDPYYDGGYYAEMLKQVYPAVKSAHSQAQVLVGGLLLDCDPRNPPPGKGECRPSKYLEGILRNGGGNYFDGVSFHAYDYYAPNDILGYFANPNWNSDVRTTGPSLILKAEFLRGVLTSYGVDSKYLINSEVAIICGSNGLEPYCADKYETTKAYYVTHSYVAAIMQNIRLNIWYSYTGWRGSGLYNKPAYNAYSFVAGQLSNIASGGEITSLPIGVKGYEFIRLKGKLWILWYKDPTNPQNINVNLPALPLQVWRWDNAQGRYLAAPVSQQINVDLAPVYVEFSP